MSSPRNPRDKGRGTHEEDSSRYTTSTGSIYKKIGPSSSSINYEQVDSEQTIPVTEPNKECDKVTASKNQPLILIISNNNTFIDDTTKQINECSCLETIVHYLTTDKLIELYTKHHPDMVIIDGQCISSANICFQFNEKIMAFKAQSEKPYLYIDTTHSQHLISEYLQLQKGCGSISYSDHGKIVSFIGSIAPGSQELAKTDNNYNVASASKLFTVLACYFAFNGEIHKPLAIHHDIELPKYIREIINLGVTAEQLMFHQAGMGNYLMKILELVKSGVSVPNSVTEKNDSPILIPKITDRTNLSENAKLLLEDKLNMDLTKQSYSNTGYYVLGLAIETAINKGKKPSDPEWKSYYQYVHEMIFADRMPNTSHVQTAKSIKSGELDKFLKGQQLPCTGAGCWYSTSDDLYRMMQWVFEKYNSDQQFKKFIDYYNHHHPLRESTDPNEFMHVGKLDTGTNAYVSLNLVTGNIFCIITNELDWSVSGLQHIVSRETIIDIVTKIAESKGIQLGTASPASPDRISSGSTLLNTPGK